VFLLAQIEIRFLGLHFLPRSAEVISAGSVLRGHALEITDDEGRTRASIKVYPASVLPGRHDLPGNGPASPDQFRRDANVKLAATEDGSALALSGEANPTHVQILARGTTSSLKLTNKNGQQHSIAP
jgi:hypothetical protein